MSGMELASMPERVTGELREQLLLARNDAALAIMAAQDAEAEARKAGKVARRKREQYHNLMAEANGQLKLFEEGVSNGQGR